MLRAELNRRNFSFFSPGGVDVSVSILTKSEIIFIETNLMPFEFVLAQSDDKAGDVTDASDLPRGDSSAFSINL